jgi:divalent metal cation (Fe/Co/Zn/Cd) transporter
MLAATLAPSTERQVLLRRAIRLEWLTLGWDLLEALIALVAATAASSVALLGFGLDSLVESASACVLLWRLWAEQGGRDAHAAERRARRIVGGLLVALALFVALDASAALWLAERPRPSTLGLIVTSLSILVMLWLATAKKRCAARLGSSALAADAFQATACWWLSLVTLAGVGLNAVFGWWWADPIAALAMVPLIGREGIQSWRGLDPCC